MKILIKVRHKGEESLWETPNDHAKRWKDDGEEQMGLAGEMFHAADRRRMTNVPLCSCPR